MFYKPATALIGPGADIIIPRVAQPVEEHIPDYEVELAIVIGKTAKNVSEEDALDYVLGYTAANDVREVLAFSWRHTKLDAQGIVQEAPNGCLSMVIFQGFWYAVFQSGYVEELTWPKPDNTNPFGPCIVAASAIPDPQNIPLKSTVNGQVLQDGNTSYALPLYHVDDCSQ